MSQKYLATDRNRLNELILHWTRRPRTMSQPVLPTARPAGGSRTKRVGARNAIVVALGGAALVATTGWLPGFDVSAVA